MKNEVLLIYAKVAVLNNRPAIYDYIIPAEYAELLAKGVRVGVPFRNKECVGIVVATSTTTTVAKVKLKAILQILNTTSVFTEEQFKLLEWFHKYYHISIASAYSLALPPGLKKLKNFQDNFVLEEKNSCLTTIELNTEQQNVANTIIQCKQFQTYLLYGVTGSGKTETYIHIIREVLKQKKQALVLVPEIGLTPQTLARFNSQLNTKIAMVHSSLTPKKRAEIYQALKAHNLDIIIGTRSAVFFPFKQLGMIVVDESHDLSYRQQDKVRYHARDVAIYRAKINNIPIVLGSATPTLESLYNVQLKKYIQLNLKTKAKTDTPLAYNILDIRHKKLTDGISARVLPKIKATLERGEQVIVFINRRGFSPVLMCTECGHTMNCENCDAKLTLHLQPYHLHCHHCLKSLPVLTECSECEADMQPIGYGTERIAQALSNIFDKYPVYRIDRDTITTQNKLNTVFSKVRTGKPCILVGTQMLAKGHDFANLSLAVIVNIDASFYSQDFRALEKLGQLITQVAGRVGRHNFPGEVCLQTTEPTEPHLKMLIEKGYLKFSEMLLKEREKINLPPKTFMAKITADAKQEINSKKFLEDLISKLPKHKDIIALGPFPATMFKRNNYFRHHLVFRANTRVELHKYLHHLAFILNKYKVNSKSQWFLEVDPQEV